MKNIKKILTIVLVAILLLVLSYFFGKRAGKLEAEPTIDSATVEQRIESIKELATTRYYYTNVGVFENQNEFNGIKIPLTQKRFIVSYDGEIKAGIDLKDASASVDAEQKEIKIKLPNAKILSHEIDDESVSVFDEKNSIFNPIKTEDFSKFSAEQKSIMEQKAIESGILDDANAETKKIIEEVLNINEEIKENYTIIFE